MLALKIIFGVFFCALYIVMMSIMIVFERDKPKKIVIWSIIFLFLQLIGYTIYLINRLIIRIKKNDLDIKQKDDLVYYNLVSNKFIAESIDSKDELFSFNDRAFSARIRGNSQIELITDYNKLKESLIKEIKQATKFVYIELTSINAKDFESVLESLYLAKENGIEIRICFDRHVSNRLIKNLKSKGIKVNRYSKHNTCDKMYSNIRNVISIDGEVAYLVNFDIKNSVLKTDYDIANTFVKLKGDIVQDIMLKLCQDLMFSSGKHVNFELLNSEGIKTDSKFQYITNGIDNRIELSLIQAICTAKKSITLELNTFIPSEAILKLLKYAIDSKIEVRLMVPIKASNMSRYYASRAYAKELALFGACVYLYDGYIRFNSIIIDDEYAIIGNYSIDRVDIDYSSQNMLITNDTKTLVSLKKNFDNHINNSYKINDAKFMLLKEKIFKNFI